MDTSLNAELNFRSNELYLAMYGYAKELGNGIEVF